VEIDGAFVFEETQTVTVTGERFTTRIGDATPNGVPATHFRDNLSLWIAFAFDTSPDTQIGARTPMTSGGYAHAAALVMGPMVRSLNGLVGDVDLAGGPNVMITSSGNTLTIGAATGLPTVSHDDTLAGNGTGGAPLQVSSPLRLTSNTLSPILSGTNNGFGPGVQGVGNIASGVSGVSTSSPGVQGESQDGSGVEGRTSGGSTVAGVFGASSGNGSTGVWGVGTGASSWGVFGRSDSPGGFGVEGRSVNGTGVKGASSGLNGIGVRGEADTGDLAVGVYGSSNIGFAGLFNGRLRVQGSLELSPAPPVGAGAPLCYDGFSFQVVRCGASSLRYKSDVRPFAGGLELLNQLRPIAFTWKQGGMHDIGLAAEEVDRVEPLLTFRNDKGEVEGVKYHQLSAVFINAFAEQQAQIKRQQEQINALTTLVCWSHRDADMCR
jgi:hypothetical protein